MFEIGELLQQDGEAESLAFVLEGHIDVEPLEHEVRRVKAVRQQVHGEALRWKKAVESAENRGARLTANQ